MTAQMTGSRPVERPFDLLVVGDLNPDLVLRGDVTPAFGQVEQLVDDANLTIGSSAAIFASGAARLGLRVAMIGTCGDDLFGHFMCDTLTARQIDVSGIVVDPGLRTGLSVILSRGDDRAILTYAGSIAALRYDAIDPALLRRARHMHLCSYFLLHALRPDVPRLLAEARTHGLTTSLDTNYDPTEHWEGLDRVLPLVDLFLPNEAEALAITRTATLDAALDRLSEQVALTAVKLGSRGSVARRGTETVQVAPRPVEAVDTTGAGDSFDAGFIYGHLHGWSLERTLRLASACGALSTRAAGGTAAQPTRAEAEETDG